MRLDHLRRRDKSFGKWKVPRGDTWDLIGCDCRDCRFPLKPSRVVQSDRSRFTGWIVWGIKYGFAWGKVSLHIHIVHSRPMNMSKVQAERWLSAKDRDPVRQPNYAGYHRNSQRAYLLLQWHVPPDGWSPNTEICMSASGHFQGFSLWGSCIETE